MDGVEDLERWAADARARDVADSRVRERWLRAQAEEDASLAGVLLGLAERRDTVVLATAAGHRHCGAVTGVGLDFVAVQVPSGVITLVALSRVSDFRVAEGGRPSRSVAARSVASRSASATTGGAAGRSALGARLADVLAQAAGQRPRVLVQTAAASVVGDLRAVGQDIVTVHPDGGAGPVYVPLASVSEVSFLASG